MKALVSCKKCGELTEVDTSIVLTSNLPQYNYQCNNCGEKGYCFTSEVTWVISEQNKQDVCVSKVSVLESTKDELTKYKRAFEILKKLLSMNIDTSIDGKVDFYTLYFTGELPYECYKYLTEEEYELLEELMKDA